MAHKLCLLDSNILIRWVQPDNRDYPLIAAALEDLVRREVILCYISQNLAEFWNACTRPVARNGFGLTPEEADRKARLFEAKIDLLIDTPSVHREFRRLLLLYRVSGVQVHDTRLVASMSVHAVKRILTFNTSDFSRFESIEALHPKDVPFTSW